MDAVTCAIEPDGEVKLLDVPDVSAVTALSGTDADTLADLWLHKLDLTAAKLSLTNLNSTKVPADMRDALFGMAIVKFFKCFGHSNARRKLVAASIYPAQLQLDALNEFKDMRNLVRRALPHRM